MPPGGDAGKKGQRRRNLVASDVPGPCPFCTVQETVEAEQFAEPIHWAVTCVQCGMRGPSRVSRAVAIEHWNELPRDPLGSRDRWIPQTVIVPQ